MYFVVRLFERVFAPLVGLPHGVTGWRPPLGAAFAAAMRMIDRLHRRAAHGRTLALPHIAAGLADDFFVHVVRVRHCPDRRAAGQRYAAHFIGIKTQDRVARIATEILRIGARRTCDLSALARLHLDIVDDGADRHCRERHGITRLHVDALTGDNHVADGQALRRQDVGEFAVLVFNQRNARRAVRVVFDAARHCPGRMSSFFAA